MNVTVDGKRLEVLWSGPPASEAPTVVFLHEGLGSAALWKDLPARVSDGTGLGAVAYSRAGYGRSDSITLPRPLDYMQREGEHVLPSLLDALGIGRAILVGHSDGASIALVGAASSRILGCVLLAPHVFCEDLSVSSIEKAREAYATGDLRARLARHHDDVDAAFWGWNRAWLDPGFRAWNIERCLPAIRCPVHVVQGAEDPYGTLAQVEAIERGVPHATRTILSPCGHAPQRDHPDEVLSLITRLARSVT